MGKEFVLEQVALTGAEKLPVESTSKQGFATADDIKNFVGAGGLVTTERQERIAGDANLSGLITTEKNRAETRENAIELRLSNEETRAAAREDQLEDELEKLGGGGLYQYQISGLGQAGAMISSPVEDYWLFNNALVQGSKATTFTIPSDAMPGDGVRQINSNEIKVRGFDYYLNSETGDDDNDGLSPETAWASPAPLNAISDLSGKAIGVAYNSIFYVQALWTGDDMEVTGYGSGDEPLFDCRDIIDEFIKTTGRTNVYESPITLPGDVKCLGNAWVDDTMLVQVSSLSACDATAGSFYVINWTLASTTIYIHAPGSLVPNVDGKVYRYSARSHGLRIQGERSILKNIRGIGNAHQDGSIMAVGDKATWINVGADDGCRHSSYARPGSLLVDCVFRRGRNDIEGAGSANAFVANAPDVVGESISTLRCTFDGGDTPLFTGPQSHGANSADLFDNSIHIEPIFINVASGLAARAENSVIDGGSFVGTAEAAAIGNDGVGLTIQNSVPSTLNRLYTCASAATILSKNNPITISLLSSGFYRTNTATGDVDLTIDGDNLTINGAVSVSSQIVRHQRGSVEMKNTIIGPAICAFMEDILVAGFSGGVATYAGSNNQFPQGSRFQLNGVVYNSLAEWQAAGHDSTSVLRQPVATLTDNFNRADSNMEDGGSWSRIGGSAAQIGVRTNAAAALGTTVTLYKRADMASPNHFVRFKVAGLPSVAGPLVVLRAVDQNNWLGVRWSGSNYSVQQCIAGAFTTGGNLTGAVPTVGDDVILAVKGDLLWLYVNGRQLYRASTFPNAALVGNVGVGLVSRSALANPWVDDFAAGLA